MVTKSYRDSYEQSLAKPEAFWLELPRQDLLVRPRRSRRWIPARAPLYGWFPDGVLNTSYNALDRHVEAGRGGAGRPDL